MTDHTRTNGRTDVVSHKVFFCTA